MVGLFLVPFLLALLVATPLLLAFIAGVVLVMPFSALWLALTRRRARRRTPSMPALMRSRPWSIADAMESQLEEIRNLPEERP